MMEVFVSIIIFMWIAMLWHAFTAPRGRQDKDGFHYDEDDDRP